MADNLNLTPERGPNVWDRLQEPAGGRAHAVSGAVMLAAGTAAAIYGGRMLYRAVKDARSSARDASGAAGSTLRRQPRDLVAEESADSFPASDAPSWTASHGATLDTRKR